METLLHSYEIVAEIGIGGSGAVYKAWHKELHKHIALKQLRDGSRKRLEVRRNEYEALKNSTSVYIPKVYGYLAEKNDSFTVMEYIEGDSFDKLLAGKEMFSTAQIAKWYHQLATALIALHLSGVCHRDIKPANIIRRLNGDVCLIDFNSALVRGNNTKVINCTPGYASPEQSRYFEMCQDAFRRQAMEGGACTRAYAEGGAEPCANGIDWKLSDIYSLGATMYHLFTGRHPSHMARGTVYSFTTREATKSIWSIIERSMQIEPSKRFASACDLRKALIEWGFVGIQ